MSEPASPPVAGSRTVEEAVASINAALAESLGREVLDLDMGFFDLGADSRVLTEVAARLRVQWPHLKVVDMFKHPNVRSLARLLINPPASRDSAGEASNKR
jgi:hypothetical protein